MKKQKSPVILVVILSSLVVGGFFVSQRTREETMTPEARMKLEMERQTKSATTESRQTSSSASEMAKAAASSVDDVSAEKPKDQLLKMRKSMGGPMANRPSIERLVRSSEKPKPNESAVSSQWYTPSSYKQNPTGQ